MAKNRTAHSYELELRRMIKERTGAECEAWLLPQVRATAKNEVMLDKVQKEIEENDNLVVPTVGSSGQPQNKVNPLIVQYDKMQRTLMMQLESLGLNYKATPSKILENTKKGGSQQDKLQKILNDLTNI